MRTQIFKPIAWLLASLWIGMQIAPAMAADGDPYIGIWSGTWEGQDSSGRFELTLKRDADGKIAGTILVNTDGGSTPDYTASLRNASFTGDKFSASYDPPGDNQGRIRMTGLFNLSGADGDWRLVSRDEPGRPSIANGNWKASKKK
jgi:hypothetical protein